MVSVDLDEQFSARVERFFTPIEYLQFGTFHVDFSDGGLWEVFLLDNCVHPRYGDFGDIGRVVHGYDRELAGSKFLRGPSWVGQ